MPCELLLVSTGLGLHLAKQAPPPAAILHACMPNSPAFRTWGAAGRVACLRRHDEPPCVPAYLGVVRSVLVGCTRGRDGLDTSILFAVWFLQSANSIFLLHSSSTNLQPPANQQYFFLTPLQHQHSEQSGRLELPWPSFQLFDPLSQNATFSTVERLRTPSTVAKPMLAWHPERVTE